MGLERQLPVRHLISLFFISAALLALEISLMRVLKVEGWGNFTYTAIALALLGFGASGTLLAIWGGIKDAGVRTVSILLSAGFIGSLGLGAYLSSLVVFDPLRIVWDFSQVYRLLLRYLFYAIPFICGSGVVLLSFTVERPGKAYFYNLLGSGFGVGAILVCFFFIPPHRIILIPLIFALISFLLLLPGAGTGYRVAVFALIGVAAGFILFFHSDIRVLGYKGIELALNVPDSEVTERRLSPFGTLEVVDSDAIRIAPGLSLTYDGEIPAQDALFLDGDRLGAIDRTYNLECLDYLLYQPQSAAYRLHESPDVFIVGLGGGAGVQRALKGGSNTIVVAEENPELAGLIKDRLGDLLSKLDSGKRVEIAAANARGRLKEARGERWDIIEISEPDSTVSSVGGIYSTDTSYIFTVEAIGEFFEQLEENGTLAVTLWLKNPPRRLLKLTAASKVALDRLGRDPKQHIIVIRSWATATFFMKKSPFTPDDIERVRSFCNELRFDLVYCPGIRPEETNRYNIVQGLTYHEGVDRILESDENFIQSYIFNIVPPTDDRPYFEYFFRVKHIPMLVREMGKKWLPAVEGGYIVLFSTFFAVTLLSALLIIIPLILSQKRVGGGKCAVLLYFSFIAVSYMFIEISLMERFRRYLANPIYANSAILAVLLIFSGVGSLLTERIPWRRRRVLLFAVSFLIVYFLLFLLSVKLFGGAVSLPLSLKLVVSLLVVAPLGTAMGMPFPLAVSILRERADSSLPWAWSINGFLSVAASTGAALLASGIGLLWTGAAALLLYFIAFFCFPKRGS